MGLLCVLGLCGQGAVYTFNSGFANGGVVPDDTTSWTDTRSLSPYGSGYTLTDVNVIITVTGAGTGGAGGYNGDLYAKLSYTPGGTTTPYAVILLNRVGFNFGPTPPFNDQGYSESGFNNVTLDDSAAHDVHHYQYYDGVGIPVNRSYQPDGRSEDPNTVWDTSPRDTHLSDFNNLNANGTWTLAFSDWNPGFQSKVVSWSLDLQVVPEPVTTALVILGGFFGCLQVLRYLRMRKTRCA